jgi:hypothetical protein
MRRKLEEQTSEATVVNTLRTTFEDRFRYDEAGLPRVWKPEDDIEAAFKKAKEEVRCNSAMSVALLIVDSRSPTTLRQCRANRFQSIADSTTGGSC